jgi:CRP/FNR family cyclic AMP-dependent transcriptional regulator
MTFRLTVNVLVGPTAKMQKEDKMVSPELIRRYPFFADLSMEQIVTLAQAADEVTVEAEHGFFREGEELDHFYIVIEGKVGILVTTPDPTVPQPVSRQLTDDLITREIIVATVEPGEMFAWSALVPPHTASSSARALDPTRIISFDCGKLRQSFAEDPQFGYLMILKATLVIRERLRCMRIETLSDVLAGQNNEGDIALQTV